MTALDVGDLPVRNGELVADKYRVERLLGRGGMGVVVAAEHEALGQKVAIKLLLPTVAAVDMAVARFLREARAAATIPSDHVCRVFDVGTLPTGDPYMVMELLDGEDLSTAIERRGPLPVDEAVGYLVDALDAVVAAHARGIVHRDLKPSNVFLCRREHGRARAKVLDFGISKLDERKVDASLTSTDTLLGSPLYMSPEQVRSAKAVDARSDVWAVGVMLFEALTARTPFDGGSIGEIFSKIREDRAPPVTALRPDVPAELARIVARCLEREPEARWGSAAALRVALVSFLEGRDAARPAASSRAVFTSAADVVRPSALASTAASTASSAATLDAPANAPREAPAPGPPSAPRSAARPLAVALIAGAVGVVGAASVGLALRAAPPPATAAPLASAAPAPPPTASSTEPTVVPASAAPPEPAAVASAVEPPPASAAPRAATTAPRGAPPARSATPRPAPPTPPAPGVDEILGHQH